MSEINPNANEVSRLAAVFLGSDQSSVRPAQMPKTASGGPRFASRSDGMEAARMAPRPEMPGHTYK